MKDQPHIPSASQTLGPFFHFALTANTALGRMAGPDARGERIHLTVRLLDADGAPVEDGMIELWQADANGKYCHPEDPRDMPSDMGLCGFGRMATDQDGRCVFEA